jgi:hypothetical protein
MGLSLPQISFDPFGKFNGSGKHRSRACGVIEEEQGGGLRLFLN